MALHNHNWKTTFVGINKPAKVLAGTADSFTPAGLWPHANGPADPYWAGGTNPQPYRWTVTFSITEGFHGSHLTRTPFRFNANDVDVGDFVAGAEDGKVSEIMSILAKDDFSLTAIIEDRLRYNTFRSATGDGLFSCPGNVIFFQINELGYPMLDPVPSTASSSFASNIMSRFQYMNPLTNYVLEKADHGFQQGDAICIEDEEFVLSAADNVNKFIGTVVFSGPGPDYFILRPANGIIDFVPNLPGIVGDYIYPSIDGTGDLTAGDESRKPIFLKIANAIPTFTIGTNIATQGVTGDVFNINGVEITLGAATLDEAIATTNLGTVTHKITASKVNASTSITTDTVNLALGVVAGVVPFTATINGVQVEFTTTTNGSITFSDPTFSDANDMKIDIDAADIENITAGVGGTGELLLTNIAGGSITIVNGTGNAFAGTSSASGLPLSVPANTTTFVLKLADDNGGPMTLRDIQGTFFTDAGVISGQNGRYAIGLNIEQGIRSGGMAVVANIVARDALYPLVGDSSYVINAGNGEWATFTYSGTQWTKVSGERSVAVDARTINANVTLPGASSVIGTVSEDRRILNVSVTVEDTLVNAPDFSINVGSDTVWQFSQHGSSAVGVYMVDTDLVTAARKDVTLSMPSNLLATGNITVEVTYI